MTPAQRKIIHVDMDSFYASIEVRDNPRLKGKPVAVGGKASERGVICTASYEARKFGVHSAMPTAQAQKLCPELRLLPVDIPRYRAVSRRMHAILADFTDLIEPLSLDEAYLDVSEESHCKGSASLMAEAIRARIQAELKLTASAGIAPNKLLAKIASDWQKPNGQFVIQPQDIDAFMLPLPVKKLHGVGQVTTEKLQQLGIETCGDCQRHSEAALKQHLGKFGEQLYQMCRGIDERPVQLERTRKSLSVEETYINDLPDLESCLNELPKLLQELETRLRRLDKRPPIKSLVLKLKFADFKQTTRQATASTININTYKVLCRDAWLRSGSPVRLIGLGIQFVESTGSARQLELSF